MSGAFVDRDATVTVRLEECLCPGTPHADGDSVELRAELDLSSGLRIVAEIAEDREGAAIERLGRAYLRAGIVAWSFLDENGKPVPVTGENVGRLRWSAGLYTLADRASDLYGEAVLSPLAARVRESSQSGPSADSTSRTPGS